MNNFEIEIIPNEGIIYGGKRILFCSSKREVENIMGIPEIVRDSFYYFKNELRFDFDEEGKVEFIEFLGGIDGELKPKIYGISVFDVLDDVLYGTLLKHNGAKILDYENGYSYFFCNISVGIYRESTPQSVNEMIKEMKIEGIPTDNNENLETEKKKAHHWATIGLGRKEYYKLE